jgi:hypothetical protein
VLGHFVAIVGTSARKFTYVGESSGRWYFATAAIIIAVNMRMCHRTAYQGRVRRRDPDWSRKRTAASGLSMVASAAFVPLDAGPDPAAVVAECVRIATAQPGDAAAAATLAAAREIAALLA